MSHNQLCNKLCVFTGFLSPKCQERTISASTHFINTTQWFSMCWEVWSSYKILITVKYQTSPCFVLCSPWACISCTILTKVPLCFIMVAVLYELVKLHVKHFPFNEYNLKKFVFHFSLMVDTPAQTLSWGYIIQTPVKWMKSKCVSFYQADNRCTSCCAQLYFQNRGIWVAQPALIQNIK